jgi:hypothetical protein
MISMIAIGAAMVQWVAFAAISGLSRNPKPTRPGMRPAERNLLISTMAVVLLWAAAFAMASPKRAPVASASSAKSGSIASCATIHEGMDSATLSARLGKPDEVRPDEETRGPSASIWVYRDSRCAVHLFDDKVEFIE